SPRCARAGRARSAVRPRRRDRQRHPGAGAFLMPPKLAFAFDPQRTRHVFDAEALGRLAACCEILSPQPLQSFATPEAQPLLAHAEILVTGWGCPMLTPEALRTAPRLKLVAHAAGTVKFTVDPSAYRAGIRVTSAAEANAVPVAEFTLAAILFA